MKTIIILATLDTKMEEAALLEAYIEKCGCRGVILDCSLKHTEKGTAYPLRQEMFHICEEEENHLWSLGKSMALKKMQDMTNRLVIHLCREDRMDGIIGIGGMQGTLIAAGAMKSLPIGIPKFIVSTVANGAMTFGPVMGAVDITIMHSVVDIAGSNDIIKQLLANAAGAVCGMAEAPSIHSKERKAVGITMGGVTTECVSYVQALLEKEGYETIIFHCNGVGAQSMEHLIEEGKLAAVMDMTPHDITDYLFGGLMPADKTRCQSLKSIGIPVVAVPGCADIILFNGLQNVPEKYKSRKYMEHNEFHTHVKADYEEMYQVGKFMAERLAAAAGPVSVLIPRYGFSQNNKPGGSLYDPEADRGFYDGIKQFGEDKIMLQEESLHINQPEFAQKCVKEILRLMGLCSEDVGKDGRE